MTVLLLFIVDLRLEVSLYVCFMLSFHQIFGSKLIINCVGDVVDGGQRGVCPLRGKEFNRDERVGKYKLGEEFRVEEALRSTLDGSVSGHREIIYVRRDRIPHPNQGSHSPDCTVDPVKVCHQSGRLVSPVGW